MDDECRAVRQRKKQSDPTCCPVCGITVRSHEIEQHFSLEVDRLHKLSTHKSRKQTLSAAASTMMATAKEMPSTTNASVAGCSTSTSSTSSTTNESNAIDTKECWSTYQRIKNNRSARLKVKNRKRKADDPLCPVCNERVADDLNLHVELCLRRSEFSSNGNRRKNNPSDDDDDDDDDSIDVEGESFEEYEWAGQTRVRASSLLEGGYSAAGLHTSVTNASGGGNGNANDDDDEDLNVDGDDTQVYGTPQYSERDIILPMADNNKKENLYLRNLVIGQTTTNTKTATPTDNKYVSDGNVVCNDDGGGHADSMNAKNGGVSAIATSENVAEAQIKCESTASCSTITIDLKDGTVKETTTAVKSQPQPHSRTTDAASAHIIDALKEKIREYEIIIRNKSKCLICMDEFRIPVVSICCWHVHCEECWLRTLGARKLCPQCNMITSPTDLRRIYM